MTERAADDRSLEHALSDLLPVHPGHQWTELGHACIEALGHLGERLVAKVSISRPGRGLERAPGRRDRSACLGFAEISPLAQNFAGGRVDRLRYVG